MQFAVLGPVGVTVHDRPVAVDRPRRRAVLAYLLLHANQVVSTERLIDALWGGTPPSTARAQIQADVSALRRALRDAGAAEPITTRARGYLIAVTGDQLDLETFTGRAALAHAERSAGRPEAAVELLRSGLGLWRGPALAGVTAAFVEPARARLEEQRLSEYEWLIDTELALGRHREIIAELTHEVAEHPLRERLRAQLMLALYRVGRQPDALRVARQAREILADEHGLDPGRELRELEQAILREDPALDLPGSGPPRRTHPKPGPDDAGEMALPPPAQLPPAPPVFAGREALVSRLVRELTGDADADMSGPGPRTVGLHGMPGVGKTTLATRVAHEARHAYPDGQLFADLRAGQPYPRSPARVLAEFLRALGVDPRAIPRSPTERTALYRSMIAERRVLVFLDDAGSAEQVLPLVPAGTRCGVLVTSRWSLDGLGSRHHLIEPLAEADALAVLAAYLGPQRLAGEPEAASEVVRACGGLPLALRVASARLHRGMWISDLASLLRDSRHRLGELEADRLAVQASLEPSVRALSVPARRVLHRMALLPTPSFPDWAPAVCTGLAPRPATRTLDDLVRSHLVTVVHRDRPGPNRYALHDLVRLYAAAHTDGEPTAPVDSDSDREGDGDNEGDGGTLALGAGGWCALVEEAARRLGLHLLAPPPGGVRRHAFDAAELDRLLADPATWIEEEQANLSAVFRAACREGWSRTAAAMVTAMGQYFRMRRAIDEWQDWVDDLDAVAARTGDAVAGAHTTAGRVLLCLSLGRYAEASTLAEAGAQAFAELGDPHGQARLRYDLCYARSRLGDVTTAAELARDLIDTYARLGDPHGQAVSHHALGVIYRDHLRDLAAAERHLARAHALVQPESGGRSANQIAFSLGSLYLAQGRTGDAERMLTAVLSLARAHRDAVGVTSSLCLLGRLWAAAGRPDAARTAFGEAAELSRRISFPEGLAQAAGGLAGLDGPTRADRRGLASIGGEEQLPPVM